MGGIAIFVRLPKTNTNNDCHTADTCLDRRLRHNVTAVQHCPLTARQGGI